MVLSCFLILMLQNITCHYIVPFFGMNVWYIIDVMYHNVFLFFICLFIFLKKSIFFSGETRRILSVNPTYDWTCFSYALLNVSPMQVESSPPMPCPEPCHQIQTCSQCLSSHGSDGGWQHCLWSMALQQVRGNPHLPLTRPTTSAAFPGGYSQV